MRILAVVCVRNEAVHISRCIRDFVEDGIDVAIVDHGSSDGSEAVARAFLGRGVVTIEPLEWKGVFSLTEQLEAKDRIVARSDHDWVIHADADEWLCPPAPLGTSLARAIARVDALGFNAVNFRELAFVPVEDEDFERPDYATLMTRYYLFEPSHPRLMRAFKRLAGLSAASSGGHILAGADVALFGTDFFLRHYIVLSAAHARRKYLDRAFASEDRSRGWHFNRIGIPPEKLRVPPHSCLRQLPDWTSQAYDTTAPVAKHFWEW